MNQLRVNSASLLVISLALLPLLPCSFMFTTRQAALNFRLWRHIIFGPWGYPLVMTDIAIENGDL